MELAYSGVVLRESSRGLGDRAREARLDPWWGFPPQLLRAAEGVYKMAARVLHPRLDSPTFVLRCSNGDRAFRSYKKRWRLKPLLQYNAEGFVFRMLASWLC